MSTPTATLRPSRLVIRLAWAGVLGSVGAIVLGRPELIALGLPALAAAAVALRPGSSMSTAVASVDASLPDDRCFEGETVAVRVRVRLPEGVGEVSVELPLPRGLALDQPSTPRGRRVVHRTDRMDAGFEVRGLRWGRWPVGPATVRIRGRGLGSELTLQVEVGDLMVYPPAPPDRDPAVPSELLARIGSHVARRPGGGVEFAEVRAYRPGDLVRQINWPVSTRRDELHVNVRLAERAADLVAIVDTTVDLGPWGRSSLDASVRGAAAVCRTYLMYADRVGVVALGGHRRWLTPQTGGRQYYRIVETLLLSRRDQSHLDPDIARLPPHALPPGALVVVFSPLTEDPIIETIRDLRERGHPVVVVDVLPDEADRMPATVPIPTGGRRRTEPADRLALRIWRLDRRVLWHGLAELGVPVIRWDEEVGVRMDRIRLEPVMRSTR